MSFHKLQTIDYLVKEFNGFSDGNSKAIPQYTLVFKMDGELYTGDFVIKENYYFEIPDYSSLRATMKSLYDTNNPKIRRSFFDFEHDINRYGLKADFHLAQIISHVEKFEIVDDSSKVIYNLKKLGSDNQLDFYFVTDEILTAVSLIETEE